jgi:hypothetical protein
VKHGTIRSYQAKCRCELCTEAKHKDNLRYNIRSLGGKRNKFNCPDCSEGFYREEAYKEHWKLVHGARK